jgi:vanillin dehydrogenase
MTNIEGTPSFLREAASLATHIRGKVVPIDKTCAMGLTERGPWGLVIAVSPWNAPMILTVRAVGVPLVCGNTGLLKPTPASQGL